MNDADRESLAMRVLILAPTVKDSELLRTILARAAITSVDCPDQVQVCEQLTAGAGALLIAEEAVHGGDGCLAQWLGRQSPWSDLPVLILARTGADSAAVTRAVNELGNVTILERPPGVTALVSVVRTALRARQRQYRLRDQLVASECLAGQLRMAMAAADAGSWQVNLATGEFSASDRAVELHGPQPGTRLNHEQALARVHPDDRASIEAALRLTFETGQPFRHEHRVPQPDGSVRCVVSHAERRGEGRQTFVIGLVQDVTERRQAERARRESEERFRALVTASSDVVYRMSADWNEMHKLDGKDFIADTAAPSGNWVQEYLYPEDQPQVLAVIREAIRTKSHFEMEHRVRRVDGSAGWTLSRAIPLLDAKGEIIEWFGAASDVTARKQAEQALADRTELLNGVLEGTTDVIFVKDLNGRLLLANAAFAAAARSTPEQLVGKTDEELFPPDVAAAIRQHDVAVIAGGSPGQLEESIPVAGEARVFLTLKAPVRDGGGRVVGVLGISRDITERKRAEELLRESEEKFRTLFESMDEGFCVIEMIFDADARPADYRFLEINLAFEKHTGLQDAKGKRMRELAPDHDADWFEIYGRVAVTGEPIRFVNQATALDGRWFEVYAFRLGGNGSRKVAILFNNITDRKRAEAERDLERRRLRAVFDQAPLAIAVIGPAGEMLSRNAVFDRLWGRPAHDITAGTDSEVYEGFHPDGRKFKSHEWPGARAVYGGEVVDNEVIEIVHASGRRIPCWFAGAPVRDDDGRVLGGVVLFRDVSVEREAEAALRASEEQRRLALDAAELGTWHVDPVTRRTKTDERFRAIFGTTEEWVDYLQLFAIMHPDDLPAVQAAVAAAIRPDDPVPYAIEYRIVRPDGAVRWVFAKGRATHEEGASGRQAVRFNGTVMDITDRKRAEESLRESEARLGGILRRSPAGIVQTDAAGRMTLVNPRWCEMLGYPEAELLGRNILEITHPSFVEETAAAFGRLIAGGADFHIEKACCRKDGSVFHVQSKVAAVRSQENEYRGMIAVVLDISERLRAEEKLRVLATELSEADRRKDVFLATLAHELRNPLAPLRSGLHVMRLAGVTGRVEQVRAMMERQLTQLVRLVDDLLDLSRVTSGKLELRKDRVDLRAVVEAAVETCQTVIEEAGHELAVVVPAEPIFVEGDAIRLAQILSNLLNNSAKYTPRGGHVRLTVEREGGHKGGHEGGTAVVSVKDDGIGIPPAMLGRVFEMFTQVDRTLEKTTGGLGIGLSLVKGLLEMHGGTIDAKSEGEGMGSEFVVRLPAAASVVAGSDRPSGQTAGAAPSARCRILIVDDNIDSADMLARLLELLGNEVRTANDGEAGVKVAAQFRPDLVLMDIGMPKLNGYEAARRIRDETWGSSMVLVALTGWGQDEDKRKSLEAGFDAHWVKPVDPAALNKLLSGLKTSDISR